MRALHRFIERPVLATVVSLVLLLLGLRSLTALDFREYPEGATSTIIVSTPYIGADAELVRGFITTPLEQAIATAEGIDYLESSSIQGFSTIRARLELGYDPNDATAQILSKVNQVSNQLPPEAENSVVIVTSEDETDAMYIAFTSPTLDRAQITDYINRAVRPRIETVAGVQEAVPLGQQVLALRIWLDPRRMAALDVAPSDVRAALSNNNYLAAVGQTKGSTITLPLNAGTDLRSTQEFERLIVRQTGDAVVRLTDVARVQLGAENYSASTFINGRPAVFLEVEVAPTSNLLETIREVKQLLPDIQEQFPAGLESTVVYDATVAIDDNIGEVVSALWQALLIVSLVILLFLGSWRSALVPAIAMPLSIVSAFLIMELFGFSLNLLTLLALILAIGTVVDDGVVIVENAQRHIEEGDDPETAAKKTVDELGSSIVAMNLVVLAVFLPVGFVGGLTGNLFTEFAYVIAGATLMSGVIGLTLSPMMCAKLLKAKKKGEQQKTGWRHWLNKPSDWVATGFRRSSDGYSRALGKALDRRWWVLAAGGVVLGSCFFLYQAAEKELSPPEDDGFLIVQAEADPNTSLDQLERWTGEVGRIVKGFAAVQYGFVVNGGQRAGSASNTAFIGASMKDWSAREQTQQELQPALQKAAAQVPGLQSVVIEPPTLPGGGQGAPVQFVIGSIDDPRAVLGESDRIVKAAQASGLFQFIDSDLKFDKIQARLKIDRERASALGVDVNRLGDELSTMLSEGYVNYFSLDERSYRVIPQADRLYRLRPEQLRDYHVRANTGGLVPLSGFVTIETEAQPRELTRFNQLNAAVLSGVPRPGVPIGKAIEFLQAEGAKMPAGFSVDYAGQARQFVNESSTLLIAFGLAVVLVFLILAAQYESFRDPVVMLVSVPMSLAGALLFFALGVVSANIYTQIGLLALIGSIIRHGILLVEFANQIQEEDGCDRREAMQKAASLRFRSIVMTTVATLISMVPLLLSGSGPGANSRFAISFVLGVGMAIGTVFTLFVVPALYTLVAAERGGNQRRDGEPQPA